MKTYIGTKEIKARPMNRQEYNDYRGWELAADENGADEGYLVEYVEQSNVQSNQNHPDHEGYISWSPADVFEKAYNASGNMTFGEALVMLKAGRKVARSGWNGKGIYIFHVDEAAGFKTPGYDGEVCDIRLSSHIAIDTTGLNSDNPAAPRSIVPWLASQTDMLANDWCIV